MWKLLLNDSGVILDLLEIDLESFFVQKVNFLNISLNINSQNSKISKSDFQISTSGNESRPGAPFKMCSRSQQYQRFEYHQKLLSQKRSYGISKSDFLIWRQIWVGANSEPVCYPLTPYQFENFLKIVKLVPPKPESTHVLRLGMYASGLQGGTKLRIF